MNTQPLIRLAIVLTAHMSVLNAAEPFSACPVETFLVQGKPAQIYGVDLATGTYQTLAKNMNASGVVNAVAFNFHDNYIYGWDKTLQTLVRIGSDYSIEPIALAEPLTGHYYVGDIALTENSYYIYRKGQHHLHGLWKIELDPNASGYLVPQRIVNGSSTYLNIYDFAFNPLDNTLYSVDSAGQLINIDPLDGSFSSLGFVGQRGTFGAIYFDVDGNLYISRNKDGKIFIIDPLAANPTAQLFANGPSSSSNDGARCAMAAVEPSITTALDFGDAPNSYGTSLADNGPRHDISNSNLYLGALVDAETQAATWPNQDDTIGLQDDDGITFISSLSAGSDALIQIQASSSGYLSGWIDYNLNGVFESFEQVFNDQLVSQGSQNLLINVPSNAVNGDTWARFRISTSTGLEPLGGASDGEVEDYRITLDSQLALQQFYPSEHQFVTLAFEDLWPSAGDYDMNDFVSHYRTRLTREGETVVGIGIRGEILAMGATFHNGFGVSLDGVNRSDVDASSIIYEINGLRLDSSPLELNQTTAVLIIATDLWDYVTPAEGCTFYRTESNCGESPIQFSFNISLALNTPVSIDDIGSGLLNPFLFATPGFNRNSIFSSPPGRNLEIHLKNQPPTALADPALLGRADDRSNSNQAHYYQNANGMPWALVIGTEWLHPREYEDIVNAYPKFADFVESSGSNSSDWYLQENAEPTLIYTDGGD